MREFHTRERMLQHARQTRCAAVLLQVRQPMTSVELAAVAEEDAQQRAEYRRAGHRSTWAREPWVRVCGPLPPQTHQNQLTSEQCRQLLKEANLAAPPG